jgi:hypothetical protein
LADELLQQSSMRALKLRLVEDVVVGIFDI